MCVGLRSEMAGQRVSIAGSRPPMVDVAPIAEKNKHGKGSEQADDRRPQMISRCRHVLAAAAHVDQLAKREVVNDAFTTRGPVTRPFCNKKTPIAVLAFDTRE